MPPPRQPHLLLAVLLAVPLAGCGGQTVLGAGDAGSIGTDPGSGASNTAPRNSLTSSAGSSNGGSATSLVTMSVASGGLSATGITSNGGSLGTSAGGASVGQALNADELRSATAVCGDPAWIFVGTVRNSRDLGGVPTADGKVACDKIYRGSQLNTLSSTGCSEFANLGIRTVIDLRTDTEATAAPADPCVGQQAQFVRAPMPTPYSLSPQDYIADLHAHESLIAAFKAFNAPSAYPVYFHCIYGRDRTGVLAALILRLLGVSDTTILSEYMRTAEAGMGAAPDSLTATLAEIDRLGGAETFLTSIGVPSDAINAVRAALTSPP